jgi:nucleoside-diphosphate-sugar epimerase
MNVLITGAGGFIGEQLVRLFASADWHVTALIRERLPRIESDMSPQVQMVRCDLANQPPEIAPVDVVVHTAAHTHLISNSTAEDYIRGNVHSALNLCTSINQIRPALVVNLSTLSVYGRIEETIVTEETPLRHPGMYGLSKYMAEQIFRKKLKDTALVCLRLPGVVGPGYFAPWLGRLLKRLLFHQPVTVYNESSLFNNIVDPQSLFDLICYLHQTQWEGCDSINMAAADPIPIREVVDIMRQGCRSGSTVTGTDSDQMSFRIDTQRLQYRLGFIPSTTRQMVSDYCHANTLSN